MSTVSVTLPNDGETIDAADVNAPFNAIIGVLNGGIDSTNITPGSLPWSVMASFTNTIPANAMQDAGNIITSRLEQSFDFVASGIVWSGDAYGSTRNASMTAGVVYINGVRVPVAVVTARAFTASRDTYVDITSLGAVTYSEVTNNAASPALAAGSIRVAIIVTGASNIVAVGSVNQGQTDKVLPIASSIPYSVSDSLGNLICSRDPDRRLLGYTQSIANLSGYTSPITDILGMSITINVPVGGRKVKLSALIPNANSTVSGDKGQLHIREGSTSLSMGNLIMGNLGQCESSEITFVPTAGVHTYKLSWLRSNGSGSLATNSDTVAVSYLKAELV